MSCTDGAALHDHIRNVNVRPLINVFRFYLILRLQSGIFEQLTNSKIQKYILTVKKFTNIEIFHITHKINTSVCGAIHTTFMFTLPWNAILMLRTIFDNKKGANFKHHFTLIAYR